MDSRACLLDLVFAVDCWLTLAECRAVSGVVTLILENERVTRLFTDTSTRLTLHFLFAGERGLCLLLLRDCFAFFVGDLMGLSEPENDFTFYYALNAVGTCSTACFIKVSSDYELQKRL